LCGRSRCSGGSRSSVPAAAGKPATNHKPEWQVVAGYVVKVVDNKAASHSRSQHVKGAVRKAGRQRHSVAD